MIPPGSTLGTGNLPERWQGTTWKAVQWYHLSLWLGLDSCHLISMDRNIPHQHNPINLSGLTPCHKLTKEGYEGCCLKQNCSVVWVAKILKSHDSLCSLTTDGHHWFCNVGHSLPTCLCFCGAILPPKSGMPNCWWWSWLLCSCKTNFRATALHTICPENKSASTNWSDHQKEAFWDMHANPPLSNPVLKLPLAFHVITQAQKKRARDRASFLAQFTVSRVCQIKQWFPTFLTCITLGSPFPHISKIIYFIYLLDLYFAFLPKRHAK